MSFWDGFEKQAVSYETYKRALLRHTERLFNKIRNQEAYSLRKTRGSASGAAERAREQAKSHTINRASEFSLKSNKRLRDLQYLTNEIRNAPVGMPGRRKGPL